MSLRRRCGWLLLAALAAPQAQAELLVEVVRSDLPAAEIEASNALVQSVARRLPQGWTRRMTAPIQLQWRTDLPAQVHGRAIGNRILLDGGLQQAWSA
ncbi:hypothetical protein L2243_23945, partial [Xanthomonas perforans]|nr:hypothetical protein [Xanthomonas perforans]